MSDLQSRYAQNIAYCRDLVRQHEEDWFLGAQFAPLPQRDKLLAVNAFVIEVTRIPELVSEAPLGAIRQQWWREALAEIYQAKPVRAHPVVEALAVVLKIDRERALRVHFEQVIAGTDFVLHGTGFTDIAQMRQIIRQSRGAIPLLRAYCLDPSYSDPVGAETLAGAEFVCFFASSLARVSDPARTLGREGGFLSLLASFAKGREDVLVGEIERDYLALRPALRALPTLLMPAVAPACLVPVWLRIARRNSTLEGPGEPLRMSALEKRLRLVVAVLTGRC